MNPAADSRLRSGPSPPPEAEAGATRRPTRSDSDPSRLIANACLVGVLAALAFAPVLRDDFVFFDDPANFLDNPEFRGLGRSQFAWAWRAHILGIYQPLGWLIHSAEFVLWGLDPRGYHLAGLLFHVANVAVLYLVIEELLARARPELPARERSAGAAIAAALYAVHPLRAEAVAWVSCQTFLHSALFWLLAILAYLRAHRDDRPRPWLLAGCWALALAAMLSKAVAVTLPLVLVILDFYPLRRLGGGRGRTFSPAARRVWLEKLPFFVIAAALTACSLVARRAEFGPEYRESGWLWRIAKASYGMAFHVVKTIAPIDLTPVRPTPAPTPAVLADPRYMLCAVAIASISIALMGLRRRCPAALAAWVAYLVVLGPSSGILRVSRMIVSERYSYLATMGWFAVMAGGLAALRPRPLRRVAWVVAAVLVAVSIPATWNQCLVWRDSETLWDRVQAHLAEMVRLHPDSADARYDLAVALNSRGRRGAATAQIRAALAIDPTSADSHAYLGRILAEQGRYEEALVEVSQAVRLDPRSADARFGLGHVLFRLERFDEARAQLSEALRLQPHFPQAQGLLRQL
jgi:protein O-mannosyl-transferase